MPTLDDVKTWIARDLRWPTKTTEDSDESFACQVTVNRYVFTITASHGYLGCTCRTRRNAPGKNHPLFVDLPDGPLNEETWHEIAMEIKRMEVQPYRGLGL